MEFKHLVRVASTDLDGRKKVMFALTKIKGIHLMLANAVCNLVSVDKNKRTGTLSDNEVEKLNEAVTQIDKKGLPEWLLNRRKDPETGLDKHIIGPDLKFTEDNDIKMLKKIKSYKGFRHQWGLPVRGQRTKSNFRKNKGKGSLGVKKKTTIKT
ncbi:MAG: 30S ribosomal protein S13 [Nanoarchaeota archaeon]|nr:30S ribosomal protein S13 [Nanoarchaeota archaeon]MBU1269920.1 30S ribosomal protein S13 [Nanoarchaeota archaeon]MBU1604161.1 30S ribosomal protein S13 [Nanoarchaeota archaeon]MBU2442504.1 30S ribosomal protein S13 [Nanoarchaeota archaeon]